jgi:imidazole glycerol-phosphate synthase subunit HisH
MTPPLKLALFDYGAGNLHSLKKALELGPSGTESRGARAEPPKAVEEPRRPRAESLAEPQRPMEESPAPAAPSSPVPDVVVTSDWDVALAADALVLPGVGSFGAAVRALAGEEERVRDALAGGLPCLGICLGMQLLFPASEEGAGRGIGLIPGHVRRLGSRIVPQMGWNDVEVGPDPLFRALETPVAYYANSFVCDVENAEQVIAWSEYEGERFAAAVRSGATRGVQFHPEKSSASGLCMIRNFLDSVVRGREEER